MSDSLSSPEEKGVSQGTKSSRRSFLQKTAVLAAAAVGSQTIFPPLPAEAAQTDTAVYKERNRKKDGELDWEELNRLTDQLKDLEADYNLWPIIEQIRLEIQLLQKTFDPRLKRLNQFCALMQNDRDMLGRPKLPQYYQQLVGSMQFVTPEQVNPFLADVRIVGWDFESVKGLMAALVEDRKRRGELDFGQRYIDAKNFVHSMKDYSLEEVEDEGQNENVGNHVLVYASNNVELTESGKRKFATDKEKIERFLDNFPYYKKIYSKVFLSSYKYGRQRSVLMDSFASGTFTSSKLPGQARHFGEININMDHAAGEGDYWTEVVFAHEAFGHGTSIYLNRALANRLQPHELLVMAPASI